MKTYQIISNLTLACCMLLMVSCSKSYLDYTPKGTITASQLANPTETENLVYSAYATLGNSGSSVPYASDWVYGSVRSDDAYKGGGGITDGAEIGYMEVYNLLLPTQGPFLNNTYVALYNNISRVNNVLGNLNNLTDAQMPLRKIRIGEMRFLRGHFTFLLKRLFKRIAYIDESIPADSLTLISNRKYTNDQLWDKIAADFQAAANVLPATQPQIGRANQYAALAYLAKVRLYQAYEQDDNNNVVNINQAKLQQVVTLCDQVINSGKYSLYNDFGKNFTFGYENGPESIIAIQYSVNDGTQFGRVALDYALNYNQSSSYGCCSFHNPSQNMVNAFKTQNGLPMFSTFNNTSMVNSADFQTNTVDPRLDHTAGIPTHPFKYSPSFVVSTSWARTPGIYGNFVAMKECQLPANVVKVGPFFGSSQNIDIIRYDDVLLMKAEALIQLGQQGAALPIINQIRTRAANSTAWLKDINGNNTSNYNITTYQDGVNIAWTQANAFLALQWERRLEFAMESPRFFDLVRWGIAAETLNAYIAVEKTRHTFLASAAFTKGRDEYLPIPQAQIDLVPSGVYIQNSGY